MQAEHVRSPLSSYEIATNRTKTQTKHQTTTLNTTNKNEQSKQNNDTKYADTT